jgi:hypothetical protein
MSAIPKPPDDLTPRVAAVWEKVVADRGIKEPVDRQALAVYCVTLTLFEDATRRVFDEGLVVSGDRGPIQHPALAVQRQLADQLSRLVKLLPRKRLVRRSGPMYDATKRSISRAEHLADPKFSGPSEAVLTLAWIIDEAQRSGDEALQRTAYGAIPSYIKACAELQITPSSLPEVKEQKRKSKLTVLRGTG